MKLIEKLAEQFVDPFTAEDPDCVPISGYAADIAEAAYIAGFRKAMEMAAEQARLMLDYKSDAQVFLMLGESEVDITDP